jgi:hypothetical protein
MGLAPKEDQIYARETQKRVMMFQQTLACGEEHPQRFGTEHTVCRVPFVLRVFCNFYSFKRK